MTDMSEFSWTCPFCKFTAPVMTIVIDEQITCICGRQYTKARWGRVPWYFLWGHMLETLIVRMHLDTIFVWLKLLEKKCCTCKSRRDWMDKFSIQIYFYIRRGAENG